MLRCGKGAKLSGNRDSRVKALEVECEEGQAKYVKGQDVKPK